MKKIRDNGIRIPVLLLGANYGITSEHESLELGANGFVEKPFKLKCFLEQLLNVLPN
jgi:DNA-binding response OmpR family regulator